MPANPRVRTNNCQGTITDNPLLIGATTMNSAGLANLGAIATQHAMIVLDPLRVAGAPEIVIVTAHTAAATSATITRAAYGSTARQHASGTVWVHTALTEDLIALVTTATLPTDPYRGQMVYDATLDAYYGRNQSDVWQPVMPMGAWTSFTPTLTQSATITKTITYAKYIKMGRLVIASVDLACTSAGTITNAVTVGVPVTAAAAITSIGGGLIYDASATTVYTGEWQLATTTTVTMQLDQAASTAWGITPNVAIASGDVVRYNIMYESAA